MKIVFATGNKGKLREASEILGKGFELITPADLGLNEDIPETGNTLLANSLQKAQYLYDRFGCDCFADDTGLEVDALGGAPGVYTARYAGESKDPSANMDKLLAVLDEMERNGEEVHGRRARFRTVVAYTDAEGAVHTLEGILNGVIAKEKSGSEGFGYDPVFVPDGYDGKTLAEISMEEKNAISHRGKAMRALKEFLADAV